MTVKTGFHFPLHKVELPFLHLGEYNLTKEKQNKTIGLVEYLTVCEEECRLGTTLDYCFTFLRLVMLFMGWWESRALDVPRLHLVFSSALSIPRVRF